MIITSRSNVPLLHYNVKTLKRFIAKQAYDSGFNGGVKSHLEKGVRRLLCRSGIPTSVIQIRIALMHEKDCSKRAKETNGRRHTRPPPPRSTLRQATSAASLGWAQLAWRVGRQWPAGVMVTSAEPRCSPGNPRETGLDERTPARSPMRRRVPSGRTTMTLPKTQSRISHTAVDSTAPAPSGKAPLRRIQRRRGSDRQTRTSPPKPGPGHPGYAAAERKRRRWPRTTPRGIRRSPLPIW
jgi:hypothetical protein